ncbi:MAG: class II fructose-bisphosphate aldolase [Candidatus Brocadiia bacterium]
MLRTSRELRAVIDGFYPFDDQGALLPLEQRCTLLASNANFDLPIQLRGFAQASAAGEGSPQIIQISYTACDQTGTNPKKLPPIEGVTRSSETRPAAIGAMRARMMLEWYTDDYQADLVWMSLDHFTSPSFDLEQYSSPQGHGGMYEPVARVLLDEAVELMGDEPTDEQMQAYLNYLTSDEFGEYARDFFGAVNLSRAAWVMIDTGDTPQPVNLASTKWIIDVVRTGLDMDDVIIEAEFSATGSSGEEEEYAYWPGPDTPDGVPVLSEQDQQTFLNHITTFVETTQADAIAYEVGSKHAAKAGERFAIDVEKLKAAQVALCETMGRPIAYAGHGGTGFKWELNLIGPVFKRNINTQHLYAGTMSQLQWVDEHREGIQNRVKGAVGRKRKIAEVEAAADSAIGLLKECRSWQRGPEFREVLAGVEARQVEFRDTAAKE